MQRRVFFRVDGGGKNGLGHLMRCFALARELKKHDVDSHFFTRRDSALYPIFAQSLFRVYYLGSNACEQTTSSFLKEHVNSWRGDALVIDLPTDLDKTCTQLFKALQLPLVVFDDYAFTPGNEDFLINAIANPELASLNSNNRILSGADYIILDEKIAGIERKKFKECVDHVLVAMGGSDPFDITGKVFHALEKWDKNIDVTFLLGPAYQNRDLMQPVIEASTKNFNLEVNLPGDELLDFYRSFDLAIISFGLSVYTMAYLGVPSIVLAHNSAGDAAAKYFAETIGSIRYLGRHEFVGNFAVLENLNDLVEDSARRKMLVDNGQRHVDGRGINRVVEKLLSVINRP